MRTELGGKEVVDGNLSIVNFLDVVKILDDSSTFWTLTPTSLIASLSQLSLDFGKFELPNKCGHLEGKVCELN